MVSSIRIWNGKRGAQKESVILRDCSTSLTTVGKVGSARGMKMGLVVHMDDKEIRKIFQVDSDASVYSVESWRRGLWLIWLINSSNLSVDNWILEYKGSSMIWDSAELYQFKIGTETLNIYGGENCQTFR